MKINRRRYLIFGIIFILLIIIFFMYINDTNIISSSNKKEKDVLSVEEHRWLKEQGVLIYGADKNAPPLRFVDKADNQYKGVVVDYINLLSLELGVNIELHPLLWEDALTSLLEGKTDICDMFRSEEREKYFLFTKPIYTLRAVLVEKRDGVEIDDINNISIATQKGDYVNEYLLNTYPSVELTYVNDIEEAIELLVNGKVDAVTGDEPVVLYQIRNKKYEQLLRIKEEPLYENEVVFSVPKSKPRLVTILNKGIESIEKTDQLESIQQKWFGISTPIVQVKDYTDIIILVFIIGGVLVLILISMSIWNYSLKQQVEKRTKEVINSKNELLIIFNGMTEYLTLIDLNFKVVNINKSFLDFLNYTKEEAIHKHCRVIYKEFNENSILDMIKLTIKQERNFEKEIISNNQYYMIRTYPLNDTSEKLNNVLVIIQNNTKEKISERQILQANKMAAIGQLAAGMGHEIRNPLGIIRNHSFIMREILKEKKAIKSLDYIDSSVVRANRIIENLLEFSRLTDDTKSWINLNEFILKILELENKTLMNRNIECKLDCDENLRFYTNKESLKHIIINLISNSIDAIDKDGKIDINVNTKDYGIILKIEDTGIGIPVNEMDNIFNPFYSTKIPGKGTGLGLYIVYNEVKKLNGDISVSSEPNVKTLFEIYLPFDMEDKSNEQINKDIDS